MYIIYLLGYLFTLEQNMVLFQVQIFCINVKVPLEITNMKWTQTIL